MRVTILTAVALLSCGIRGMAFADTAAPAAVQHAQADEAQQRTERALDIMLFESGLFVASIAEVEPYMDPDHRERGLRRLTRGLDPQRAEAARAYMAEFDSRFAAALERARPQIVTRVADALQTTLSAEELAALQDFVLGEDTSALFLRMMREWVGRGGSGKTLDVANYTNSELMTLAAFMEGPGGRVFDEKADAFDAIMLAEFETFVPAFEREFTLGLCEISGEDCPRWTR
ncbi:MAG TPA: hypothetical protein VEA80_11305 [Vitreimonas sp.]|uniref:hypothetical protein n=1 Tax=Vitreimonas sp. TaxID=3069702 RepID=UPI002D2EA041|nr:hypothetical protein [Vitreimonas sp.]HYD88054.1 hypothetical protein [Vitreimonas sp.]